MRRDATHSLQGHSRYNQGTQLRNSDTAGGGTAMKHHHAFPLFRHRPLHLGKALGYQRRTQILLADPELLEPTAL